MNKNLEKWIMVMIFLAGLLLVVNALASPSEACEKMEEKFLKVYGFDVRLESCFTTEGQIGIFVEGRSVITIGPLAENRLSHELLQTEKVMQQLTREAFDTLCIFGRD